MRTRTAHAPATRAALALALLAAASIATSAQAEPVIQSANTESGYVIVNPWSSAGTRSDATPFASSTQRGGAAGEFDRAAVDRVIRDVPNTEAGYVIVSPSARRGRIAGTDQVPSEQWQTPQTGASEGSHLYGKDNTV